MIRPLEIETPIVILLTELIGGKNLRSIRLEQAHVIKPPGEPPFRDEPDREATVLAGLTNIGGNRIAFLNEVVWLFSSQPLGGDHRTVDQNVELPTPIVTGIRDRKNGLPGAPRIKRILNPGAVAPASTLVNVRFHVFAFEVVLDPAAAREKLKLLWLACGKQDGLIRISQGVHQYLKENNVPRVWHVDSHGHDGTEWAENLYLFAQHIFTTPAAAGKPAGKLVLRVNCGAFESYKDKFDNVWAADQELGAGQTWGADNGMTIDRPQVGITSTEIPRVSGMHRFRAEAGVRWR